MGSCGFPLWFYCPSEWLLVVDGRCIYETDVYSVHIPLSMFIINNISMYVCMKLFYFKHKNLHTFVLLGIVHGGARVCLASLLSCSEWLPAPDPPIQITNGTQMCASIFLGKTNLGQRVVCILSVEKTGVGAFVSQTHSLIYVMSGHSDLTTPPLQMQQYQTIFTLLCLSILFCKVYCNN